METIGKVEAQENLDALLDRVERGEEVTITRDGKPVARLVAAPPAIDYEDARRAVEEIREMRKGVTLGGILIRDLINDGRR